MMEKWCDIMKVFSVPSYSTCNCEHMNTETHPLFSKQTEQSHSLNLAPRMITSFVCVCVCVEEGSVAA